MAEVRAGVDALDRELIALLRRRFDYMDAAARIKPERGQVRDEARKAQVIANARAHAAAAGLPEQEIGQLWDTLVEASIAYELAEYDRRVTKS
jgi:isochorismate pyruvate lyase